MKTKGICQECKTVVDMMEYHTYDYCLIAKAYPQEWRDIVKRILERGVSLNRNYTKGENR